MRNTFTRTSGSTYTCDLCGRLTRNTGEQAIGSDLCPQCWDLCGLDNEANDTGESLSAGMMKHAEAQLDEIRRKGGDADKVRKFCGYLFGCKD